MFCAFPVSITHDPFTLRHLTCVHSLLLIFTDLKRFYFFRKTCGALLVEKKKSVILVCAAKKLLDSEVLQLYLYFPFYGKSVLNSPSLLIPRMMFSKKLVLVHIVGSCNISPSKNIIVIFYNFPLAIGNRSTDRLHLISALCVYPALTYENICLWCGTAQW